MVKAAQGCFPSRPRGGAEPSRLKGPRGAGYPGAEEGCWWGAGRMMSGSSGPPKSVSGSEAATVTSLCHRLRLLGGWEGVGRRSGRFGGAGRGAATQGCGREKGKTERLLKDGSRPRSPHTLPPSPWTQAPLAQTHTHTHQYPKSSSNLKGPASPSSSSAASSSGRGGGRQERG